MDVFIIPAGTLHGNHGLGIQSIQDLSGLLLGLFMVQGEAHDHGLASPSAALELLFTVAHDHTGRFCGLGQIVHQDVLRQNDRHCAKGQIQTAGQGCHAHRAVRLRTVPVQDHEAGQEQNGIALSHPLVQQLGCTEGHGIPAALLSCRFIGFSQRQSLQDSPVRHRHGHQTVNCFTDKLIILHVNFSSLFHQGL